MAFSRSGDTHERDRDPFQVPFPAEMKTRREENRRSNALTGQKPFAGSLSRGPRGTLFQLPSRYL
eukprot:3558316-Pyramimonas_sp.AAC.1